MQNTTDTKDIKLGGFIFAPIKGRHYLLSRFNAATKEVFYDVDDNVPLGFHVLLPPFFQIHTFRFEWKQIMTEDEAISRGLKPLLTFEQNIQAKGEGPNAATVQKLTIVQRVKNDQHYLNDEEIHPFYVDIITPDGGALRFIYNFTIIINDMQTVLAKYPAGNFLTICEKKLITEISTYLRSNEFDFLLKSKDSSVENNTIRAKLNTDFTQYGFELKEFLLEQVVVHPNSQDRVDEEENARKTGIQNKVKVETATADATVVKTKADAEAGKIHKEGTAQTTVLKERTKEMGIAEAEALGRKLQEVEGYRRATENIPDPTAARVSYNLGKTTGTVVVNGDSLKGDDALLNSIIANDIQTKKEKGGTNGKI